MGQLTESGVLAVKTDQFTGRSPQDRYIVKDHITEELVWWGDSNISFSTYKFDGIRIDTIPEVHADFWSEYGEASGVFQMGECFNGNVEGNCFEN